MAIVNSHFATVQAKEGEDSAQLLADIEGVIGQCRRCALCEGRTNVVPGFGNPAARVMLVGEALAKTKICRGVRLWAPRGITLPICWRLRAFRAMRCSSLTC
mgnify:CR=1 FL=1